MSWHFLLEGAEASWPGNSLDGAPSALLKLIPTPEASSLPDSVTESLSHSQCGMMSPHLTESHGAGELMSSRQDSPAKTSAPQELEPESKMERAQGCGKRLRESLAKYCRVSRSWKIARCLPIGGLELSCETWPKWGTMRNGECFQQKRLASRIKENASSLLPTPLKSDGLTMGRFKASSTFKAVMGGHQNKFCYIFLTNSVPLSTAISITEQMMGWPKQWTALDAVEMDGFHKWLSEHGMN